MLRHTFVAAALTALAACASATDGATDTASTAPSSQDCFRNDDVSGYGVIDDRSVSIRARGRDYIMTTLFNARDLDWTQAIALRSTTGWICTGNGLGVEIIGGEPTRRYPVNSITRAPEEPEPTGS